MKKVLRRWRQAHFSFPLAVILSVCLLLVSEYSYQRSTVISAALDDALEARLQLQSLLRQMLDAETGQRGYLLTGTPAYLRPYQDASVSIDNTLKLMRQRYLNNPATVDDFERLATLVAKKMEELGVTVALRGRGDDAWLAVLETNTGRMQMMEIRTVTDKLRDRESSLIAQHQTTLRRTQLISRIGIAAMTALSLMAFAMYLRQSILLARVREEQRKQLQKDHDTLEAQVQDRTRRLTRLASYLQNVREDERERLARELHDELGALLVAAKLDLARIKSRLPNPDDFVKERLFHLGEALSSGISLKRRIIEDLHPSSLSKLGLVSALEIQTREFSERSGIEVVCELDSVALTPAAELTVYRLVQESLTNIAKYAQATQVQVHLKALDNSAQLVVSDNGKGFDVEQMPASSHGLEGMQYRVVSSGGKMQIESQPGAGTVITALLPLVAPAAAANSPSNS
ncbi:MAG: CHASE3 domain-containing protein [Spongiibacteraceae bacterium]